MTTALSELGPFTPRNVVLREDYERCVAELRLMSESQFHRRMLLRSGLAYIEGLLFQFKQSIAGLLLARHFIQESQEEESVKPSPYTGFLSEKSFRLKENGDIHETNEFIKLTTNLNYTFKIAAELFQSEYELEKGVGWEGLIRAIEARNRITHPKDTESMEITDEEVDAMSRSVVWFDNAIVELFEAADFPGFLRSLQRGSSGNG